MCWCVGTAFRRRRKSLIMNTPNFETVEDGLEPRAVHKGFPRMHGMPADEAVAIRT
jgi:hypothetical protein